jgi:hypothetical protein
VCFSQCSTLYTRIDQLTEQHRLQLQRMQTETEAERVENERALVEVHSPTQCFVIAAVFHSKFGLVAGDGSRSRGLRHSGTLMFSNCSQVVPKLFQSLMNFGF